MRTVHVAICLKMDTVTRSWPFSEFSSFADASSSSSMPIRPHKRLRKPELWKRNVAKAKRAKGEAYVSHSTGQVVEAAHPGPPCSCKRRCFSQVHGGREKDNLFWFLGARGQIRARCLPSWPDSSEKGSTPTPSCKHSHRSLPGKLASCTWYVFRERERGRERRKYVREG